MKVNKRKYIMRAGSFFTLAGFILLLMMSCDITDELRESPPHIMTGDNLFQDRGGFESAINGLYSRTRGEFTKEDNGGGVTSFNQGTDCCTSNHPASYMITNTLRDYGVTLGPTNEFVNRTYSWLYDVINIANNIIQRAEDENSPLTQDDVNIVLADAKAVRAWAYRHLTYLFGDVPLTLEPSSGANIRTDWTRAPINEVRQQMIDDLQFAQQHLPVNATMQGRMTKGAAQHYISETYLAMGQDQEALQWANEVINEPQYELITERYGDRAGQPGVPYMDMFREANVDRENGNTEALWVFQYQFGVTGGNNYRVVSRRVTQSRYARIRIDGVNPLEHTVERGGRGLARASVTKWFLDLYEDQDDRGSNHAIRQYFILKDADENDTGVADTPPPGWAFGDTLRLDDSGDITVDNNNRTDWPFSRKFDWAIPENPTIPQSYHNHLYLRLADTYLLKAEAQHNLGDNPGAATTINIVRSRSNASPITAADVDIDFILDERARELVWEEHRRHTLVRTGKFLERTRLFNHNGGQNVEDKHALWPIPQDVIDANVDPIDQNPGY